MSPKFGPVPDGLTETQAFDTIDFVRSIVAPIIGDLVEQINAATAQIADQQRSDYQTLVTEVNRVLPMVAEQAATRAAAEVPRAVYFQGNAQPRDKVIERDAAGHITRIVET